MSDPGNDTATEERERRERILRLGHDIAAHLNEIRLLYQSQVAITLIVRVPSHPDGRRDTVLTNDPDPLAAVEAFRRAMMGAARFEYHDLKV